MCAPALVATPMLLKLSLATSVATAAAGFAAQAKASSDQGKFQNSQYKRNAANAIESFEGMVQSGNERLVQEAAAASVQSRENARGADEMVGVATARSAAGGVGGVTASELQENFLRLEAENENVIRTNLSWARDQMGNEFKGFSAGTRDRIASATPGPINRPNVLGLLTSIGGSFLDYGIAKNGLPQKVVVP